MDVSSEKYSFNLFHGSFTCSRWLGFSSMQRVGNLGDSLYNVIKPDVQMLCDRIVNVLDYNFADDFSVCVKIMDVKSNRLSVQEDDIFLHTYARCWKRIAQRSQGDGESIPLKRNTDFLKIFRGNLSSFSCGNLPLYSWIHNSDLIRKLFRFKTRYDTSSSDYLDNYHSTIVVPIRLDCQFVPAPYLPDSGKKNQLLGFLCLDCEHRLSKMMIRKMLPYMEAFADSLYTLFDEILSSEFEQKLLGIVNDGN